MRHLALAGLAATALFVGSVPALADGEYTFACYLFASGSGDSSAAPTDFTSSGVVHWQDGTQNPIVCRGGYNDPIDLVVVSSE